MGRKHFPNDDDDVETEGVGGVSCDTALDTPLTVTYMFLKKNIITKSRATSWKKKLDSTLIIDQNKNNKQEKSIFGANILCNILSSMN